MRAAQRLLALLACSISLGAAAQMPKGDYLDGNASKVGVILAHGQGLTPDSHVVGPLRRTLNKELGYHTISLQMPTIEGKRSPETFQEYASTFPDAYTRIQAAIDFLRNERGVERVYLMGYSMGSRMGTAFLANYPDAGVVGFIGVGMLAGGQEPLNSNLNLRKIKVPVIDIYAENDRDAQFAANRKAFVSNRFVQVPLAGATHEYRGYDKQIADAVIAWLKQQEK